METAPGSNSYPHPTSRNVAAVMRGNRKADTRPELRVRSLLHRRGYRFRKDFRIDLPGVRVRADIAFPRHRLAIFIDGCFWHGCPEHGNLPRANAQYWLPKLKRNSERDRRVDARLGEEGWTVVRIWEHVDPQESVARIVRAVGGAPAEGSEVIGRVRPLRRGSTEAPPLA
ncbi:MAG: very short patch repair endonuclease [Gemmatimonadaceae bacterium]